MVETVHGIIVQVIPYREQDAILTLLSPNHGLITFKARGINKITSKNNAACQMFSEGEYVVDFAQEEGNRSLRTAELVFFPKVILESLQASIIFQLFAEGILKVGVEDYSIAYQALHYVIHHYQVTTHGLTMVLIILGQFLHWSGNALEMDRCVNCGTQKQIVAVSPTEGGLLCSSCQQELSVTIDQGDYIRNFRIVMRASVEKVDLFKVEPTHGFKMMNALFDHLQDMGGIHLKSREVLRQVL